MKGFEFLECIMWVSFVRVVLWLRMGLRVMGVSLLLFRVWYLFLERDGIDVVVVLRGLLMLEVLMWKRDFFLFIFRLMRW